jgi:hypothetical protein
MALFLIEVLKSSLYLFITDIFLSSQLLYTVVKSFKNSYLLEISFFLEILFYCSER